MNSLELEGKLPIMTGQWEIKGKGMSCYFRHIKDILAQAGIEVTPENKKSIDQALHEIVGVPYKACPAAWKAIKEKFLADAAGRKRLSEELAAKIESR